MAAASGAANVANGIIATVGKAGDSLGVLGQHMDTFNAQAANLKATMAATKQTLSTVQGGGGYFGGAEEDPMADLRNYAASVTASTHDTLIRGLARALKAAGIAVNPEGTPEEIVRALKAALPDPSQNKTSFAADAASQEDACRTIAKVLNTEFASSGPPLIDTKLDAVNICRQLSELASTMSVGLSAEFLEVHASLTRALQNLAVLDEVLANAHRRVQKVVADAPTLKTGDEKISQSLEALYERAQAERAHQMRLVQNLLAVNMGPAAKELEIAMQNNLDQLSMVRKLGLKGPGGEAFGDTLYAVVSGIGGVAAVSSQVAKALKEAGMNVESYLHSPSRKALDEALDKHMYSKGANGDVGKFLKAAHTLRTNFDRRAELRIEGGADEARSKLDRRVESRQQERRLIVVEFVGKLGKQYESLLAAVKTVGPHLGREIPIGETLNSLRDALDRLGQAKLGVVSLELALIGLYGNAEARDKKDKFLSSLRDVLRALDTVMAHDLYRSAEQYFAPMRAATESILRTVDFFSDIVVKKYGGDEDDDDDITGGAIDGLDSIPEMARSGYDLEKSVDSFKYFYYVAKVRENLTQSRQELETYGEKYADVLSDAVAAKLRQLETARLAERDAAPFAEDPADGPEEKKARALARAARDEEAKTKADFYKTILALDLYMKAFTDGIVANPDDVKDVEHMLGGVDVIANWFTDGVGDDLAQAFDMMPVQGVAAVIGVKTPAAVDPNRQGDHYYVRVAGQARVGGLLEPGDPQLYQSPLNLPDITKKVDSVYSNFQALKNITNVFVRFGNKFGGKELQHASYKSPTQIYTGLIQFLKKSAVTVGQLTAAAGAAAAHPIDQIGVRFGSVAGAVDRFAVENKYFVYCIKAMAAKILTVLGVYSLFERPTPDYALTPTRMIIGGYDYDSAPEAIPAAAELYFRLPRMAEFYRDLFAFKDDGAASKQISMLPEMDGTFSGLINLVFRRDTTNTAAGDYSDQEGRAMVREVNAIYEHHKSRAQPVKEALSQFIMEVNRRYGVVKRTEWNLHKSLYRESIAGETYADQNMTNYAILPGEGEYEPERAAPSDRYMGLGPAAATALPTGDNQLDGFDMEQWKMLKAFRGRLDETFASLGETGYSAASYMPVIDQGRREMEQATAPDKRLDVAIRLIQGGGGVSAGQDVGKIFMFHETAVVGLNTLSALYTTMDTLRTQIVESDVPAFRARIAAQIQRQAGLAACAALTANAAGIGGQAAGAPVMVADPAGAGAALAIDHNALLAMVRDGAPAGALARDALVPANNDPMEGRGGADYQVGTTYGAFFQAASAAITAVYAAAAGRYIQNYPGGVPLGGVPFVPIVLSADDPLDQPGLDWIKAVTTYGLDAERAMDRTLQTVGTLTNNFQGLVNLRFPGTSQNQVHLDFAGMRSRIQDLVGEVRYFLDLFRPHIPRSVYDQYAEGANKPGTLPWLEVHLMDGMVRGLSDDAMRAEADRAKTFEWMSRTVNRTYAALVAKSVALSPAVTSVHNGIDWVQPGVIAAGQPAADAEAHFEQYGRLLCRKVFYDMGQANSGLNIGNVAVSNNVASGLNLLVRNVPIRTIHLPVITGHATAGLGNNASSRLNLWDSDGGLELQSDVRSMLITYNQLLANYVQTFYDASGGRIYRGLLDTFANGASSQAVMGAGYSLPDMVLPAGQFGRRGDPVAVLAQSLALVFRRLASDINPASQSSDYMTATLSETPLYIRESYRANLPTYIQMFEHLQKEGEMVKQLLVRTEIRVARLMAPPGAAVGTCIMDSNGNAGGTFATRGATSEYAADSLQYSINTIVDSHLTGSATRAAIVHVIDSIAAGCYAVSNAAVSVLRELADAPLYFQTGESSIEDYQARHGIKPLMPLSIALAPLVTRGLVAGAVRTDYTMFPRHGLGSAQFKLMYGTRKLFGRPGAAFGVDDAPGARETLDAYNRTAAGRDKIDDARYGAFVKSAAGLLRYMVEIRHVHAPMVPVRFFNVVCPPLVTDVAPAAGGVAALPINLSTGVYAVKHTLEETLALVESSFQDQARASITAAVGGAVDVGNRAGTGTDRKAEWAANFIDMNAIPINVHALMRGIPLAPTYNYAYTFDQMSCLAFGTTEDRIARNDPADTRDMFLKLVCDPHMVVTAGQYGGSLATQHAGAADGFVTRIFRGDDSLRMGRPKFSSDQLFNKALFGTLVDRPNQFDEAGPPGSGRAAIGPEASSADIPGAGLPPGRIEWRVAGANRRMNRPGQLPRPAGDLGNNDDQAYGALTYLSQPIQGQPASSALRIVPLGVGDTPAIMRHLAAIGKSRFDTSIVRNLFFLTNVQRLVRQRLNQELTQNRDILAPGHHIVDLGITEYGFNANGAVGMNEVYNDSARRP